MVTMGSTKLFRWRRSLIWASKVDDSEVIGFLLPTEMIPLYLSTMEMGCELTRTRKGMPETETMATVAMHSCRSGQQRQTLPWIRRDSGMGGRSLLLPPMKLTMISGRHAAARWRLWRGGETRGRKPTRRRKGMPQVATVMTVTILWYVICI